MAAKKAKPRVDVILQVFAEHPDGITLNDLQKQMDDKDIRRTQALISYLKGKRGYNVIKKGGKYYFGGEMEAKANISILSPEDKVEYQDLIKRAHYYKLCAEALIKATVLGGKGKMPC
jgi:hypothetical protein